MPTVRLTWTDPNSGIAQEDEVRVYRATAPFDLESLPSPLATLVADTTTYDDATAVASTSYWYAVAYLKGSGIAASFSDEVYVPGSATMFTVTVPSGTVASDLSGFPVIIHLADMPAEFWVGVDASGDNIRAYAADGVTLVPHDVAHIDTVLKVGTMAVRRDVAAASATVFKIGLLASGTAALAATDPNGRNAVWAGYEVAVIFPSSINRVDGSAPSVAGAPYEYKWKETKAVTLTANQGIAFDGTTYYAVSTNALRRYNSTGTLLTTNADPVGNMVTATGDATLNHCGAPAIVDGQLWVPVEKYPSGPYVSQYIARFNLTTLALESWTKLTGANREASGFHYDAALGRLYVSDYTNGASIPYYNKDTGTYLGELTLTSTLSSIEGITEVGGKYYVAKSLSSPGIYEIEKSGTVNGLVLLDTYNGTHEGVFTYGGELLTTKSGSDLRHWGLVEDLQGWARIHGDPIGYRRSKSTIYTMAVSWLATPTLRQSSVMGVRAVASATDRHSGLRRTSGTQIGWWNTTNGWLHCSPTVVPVIYETYRCVFAQNDTAARKLTVNGTSKGTAASSSPRPLDAGDQRYEIAGAVQFSTENGYGYFQYAWVRHAYMSDDWIEADHKNFADPASFYTITLG